MFVRSTIKLTWHLADYITFITGIVMLLPGRKLQAIKWTFQFSYSLIYHSYDGNSYITHYYIIKYKFYCSWSLSSSNFSIYTLDWFVDFLFTYPILCSRYFAQPLVKVITDNRFASLYTMMAYNLKAKKLNQQTIQNNLTSLEASKLEKF